jgi:hypothetical protein
MTSRPGTAINLLIRYLQAVAPHGPFHGFVWVLLAAVNALHLLCRGPEQQDDGTVPLEQLEPLEQQPKKPKKAIKKRPKLTLDQLQVSCQPGSCSVCHSVRSTAGVPTNTGNGLFPFAGT